MSEIPKEHQLLCSGCGRIIDMRDPGQVLSHGWVEGDNIVCYLDDEQIVVPYTSSMKIGDNVEWIADKKPIPLN
jgi:hypothetical protein